MHTWIGVLPSPSYAITITSLLLLLPYGSSILTLVNKPRPYAAKEEKYRVLKANDNKIVSTRVRRMTPRCKRTALPLPQPQQPGPRDYEVHWAYFTCAPSTRERESQKPTASAAACNDHQ
eukprot:scaffold13087_cov84-Skeletonema_dohrnii-CCMP3373.AAC.2